jgi:hypothetical protein
MVREATGREGWTLAMTSTAMAPSKLNMEVASSPLKVEAVMGGGGEDLVGEREERGGEGWRRSRAAHLGVEAAAATASVDKGGQVWKRGCGREREVGGEWRCERVGWVDMTRGGWLDADTS